jgi:hypothetical protein
MDFIYIYYLCVITFVYLKFFESRDLPVRRRLDFDYINVHAENFVHQHTAHDEFEIDVGDACVIS